MTIGIAILCDSGQSVVVVADRSTTLTVGGAGSQATFELDADLDKIVPVNPRTLSMFAGSLDERHSIETLVGDMSRMTMSELGAKLKEACEHHCRGKVDRFFRERGTSLVEVTRHLVSQKALDTLNSIAYPKLEGGFIVAGFDSTRARILSVDDETASDQTSIGFEVIGSAAPIAFSVLVSHKTQQSISLARAIYLAYEAKRAAETVQGIGRNTQLGFVTKHVEATFLTVTEFDELESIYERRHSLGKRDEAKVKELLRQFSQRDRESPARAPDRPVKAPRQAQAREANGKYKSADGDATPLTTQAERSKPRH